MTTETTSERTAHAAANTARAMTGLSIGEYLIRRLQDRGARVRGQRSALVAVAIGVEDEPPGTRVEAPTDHHACRRAAVGIDGRERHRRRVPQARGGVRQPLHDERQRI